MKKIVEGSMRRLTILVGSVIIVIPMPYYVGKYTPLFFGFYESTEKAETWAIGMCYMVASMFAFFILKAIVDFILYNKRD